MPRRKPKDSPIPTDWLEYSREWDNCMETLDAESDRAVAILAVSYFDIVVKDLLLQNLAGSVESKNRLVDGFNAPLSSFSARLLACHCMGLVGPNAFSTIEAIRDVRNVFAHFRKTLTFESPEIKAIIESRLRYSYILPHPPPDLSLMRNRYIWTTRTMIGILAWSIQEVPSAMEAKLLVG